jgi:hypothetical protein
MKLSISISSGAADKLQALVASRNSNPSLVLEASLLRFAELPGHEQERDIRRLHQSRKATSRDGWMHVFWQAIAEEFDAEDFDRTGYDNPMAPRSHHGFDMVYLYDERNPTSGPIYVHVFESRAINGRALMHNWDFNVDDSVYSAAREVANWVRANEHFLQTS